MPTTCVYRLARYNNQSSPAYSWRPDKNYPSFLVLVYTISRLDLINCFLLLLILGSAMGGTYA
jgi:hypothetical protein